MSPATLWLVAPDGVPFVTSGDDLGAILAPVLAAVVWPDSSVGIGDDDIVVVASKIVSKAEGRIAPAHDREAVIDAETVRLVASRENPDGSTLRIVENRQGIVMAAAGVDASNTLAGTVLLLPVDPDDSARRLRDALGVHLGVRPAVVLTDSAGRPWRAGSTDLAIGAAGIAAVDDRRGTPDDRGRALEATVVATADEVASAADLLKGPTGGRPVAVLRGLGRVVTRDGGPGARTLNRTGPDDMFALGTAEARERGYAQGFADGQRARSADI